jgi:hypothetical protein
MLRLPGSCSRTRRNCSISSWSGGAQTGADWAALRHQITFAASKAAISLWLNSSSDRGMTQAHENTNSGSLVASALPRGDAGEAPVRCMRRLRGPFEVSPRNLALSCRSSPGWGLNSLTDGNRERVRRAIESGPGFAVRFHLPLPEGMPSCVNHH